MFNVKEDLLAYGTTGNNLANIKILRLRKIKSLFNSIYNDPNITIEEIISSLNDVLVGFDEQDFKSAFNFVSYNGFSNLFRNAVTHLEIFCF